MNIKKDGQVVVGDNARGQAIVKMVGWRIEESEKCKAKSAKFREQKAVFVHLN